MKYLIASTISILLFLLMDWKFGLRIPFPQNVGQLVILLGYVLAFIQVGWAFLGKFSGRLKLVTIILLAAYITCAILVIFESIDQARRH